MKFQLFLTISAISSVHSQITTFSALQKTTDLVTNIIESDMTKEMTTKLADKFTKLGSIASTTGMVLGPVGFILSFVFDLVGLETDKDNSEEYLKNITEKLENIELKVNAIDSKLTLLDAKLSRSTSKILAQLKFQNFLLFKNEIDASKQHFEAIIASFNTNTTALLVKIEKFIDDHRRQSSGTKLINFLDSGGGISDSIVDNLIEMCRLYSESTDKSPKTSTMKMINDVYMSALAAIIEENLLMESSVDIKAALTGNNQTDDRDYNRYVKEQNLRKYYASLQKAFEKLNANDTDGFIDLTTNGDEKPVKFRYLKTKLELWENVLSGTDTCTYTCYDHSYKIFNAHGCYGRLHSCEYHSPGWLRGFVKCDICQCTCDQLDSVKYLYTGKVSAPDGYVVTGIRIVEKMKTIFPQIQVGRLLPLGKIDVDSVHWQQLPHLSDISVLAKINPNSVNYLWFNKQSDMKFEDSVVTGVSFDPNIFGWIFRWSIYGRRLLNFHSNSLDQEQLKTTNILVKTHYPKRKPGLSSGAHRLLTEGFLNFQVAFDKANYVPYFDGNDITFDEPSPLSSITFVYYSNSDDYAGYIRPVISSLNYKKFLFQE